MSHIREKAEYALTRTAVATARHLPQWMLYWQTRLLALFLFCISFRRRTITLRNLKLAFPQLGRWRRLKIGIASFLNMADTTAESFLILAERIRKEHFDTMIDGSELTHLKNLAEKNQDNGVLFITAHIGNWELMAHYVGTKIERPLNVVARETSNPFLEKHFVTPLRTRFGNRVIYKKNALRQIIKCLRKGEHVGMLIDQKTSRTESISVPFLGHPVRATATPALLQSKYDLTVVPLFLMRKGTGQYKLKVGEPVPRVEAEDGDSDEMTELTAKHQKALEDMVCQCPSQWLWMHDRWRLKNHQR